MSERRTTVWDQLKLVVDRGTNQAHPDLVCLLGDFVTLGYSWAAEARRPRQ